MFIVGPHKEEGFTQWLSSEFVKRDWHLELQAPQGPYTNVLDLQVFPAMSKRHSELLQMLPQYQYLIMTSYSTNTLCYSSTSTLSLS
jgi:hypothetical protein